MLLVVTPKKGSFEKHNWPTATEKRRRIRAESLLSGVCSLKIGLPLLSGLSAPPADSRAEIRALKIQRS